jgi:hypothetical protein
MTDALDALRDYENQNGNRGLYAQTSFQHVAVLFSKITAYSFAGQATMPGVKIWLNGTASDRTIAHELGHNLGVTHAYAWKPATSAPIGNGTHVEYGDPFDRMGTSVSLKNAFFGIPKKRALGFITDANLVSVRTSGDYRIFRHDGEIGSRVVGLKVDAGTAYDYWIEYRKQAPEGLADYADAMAAGVQLRWNKLPNFTQAGATGTYLLDMTPGSAGDMKDSMLTLGNSFYDPTHKIRITPLRTGSSSEGDWIDVAVVLGDTSTNRSPIVQSAAAAETAFARVPVNLSARASDADGNAVLYQWDLGDGKPVYSTEGTVQKLWAVGGAYSVTVRAFDIYGGESQQTFQIKVEDPLINWNRVSASGWRGEDLYAISYGGGRFVAVGAYAGCFSNDGISWTRSSGGLDSIVGVSVAFGSGRFVTAGYSYDFSTRTFRAGLAHSNDGNSWTPVSLGRSEFLRSVAYGVGRFVAVGDGGVIYMSMDGKTWNFHQLLYQTELNGICFDGNQFIVVGEGGLILSSRNGTTWSAYASPTAQKLYSCVSFVGGVYAISSTEGAALGPSGVWEVFSRTYMPFNWYPEVVSLVDGEVLLTFPTTSNTSNASVPRLGASSDGRVWAVTNLSPDELGPLSGASEAGGRIVLVGYKGQIYYTSDGPPAIARQPQTQAVTAGGRASLSVTAYATGPFTYQWRRNGSAIAGATRETLSLTSAVVADSGEYTVAVSNARGVVVSAVANLTVRPPVSAPVIVGSPASRVITEGSSSLLSVSVSGTPLPSLQWFRNGVLIPGATEASYRVNGAGSSSGGVFTLVASNSEGRAISAAATVRVIPTSRLANLSVRTSLGVGQALIVGAVVAEGSKGLLLRAAGPALGAFGLRGLPDPVIELYTGGTGPAASNDDWSAGLAPLFQSAGAFGFVVGSKDAALNPTLSGAFTVQVKGPGSGAVLVEAYDLAAETSPRLVNLSARHFVGTDADVLIAGFVVGGAGSKRVLVRAVGPTLSAFGVAGALADPQLEVMDTSGRVLGGNDTWSRELESTFAQVGAFPLLGGSRDAAALVTLPAGAAYTVKVSGVNGSVGEALIEIYEVF